MTEAANSGIDTVRTTVASYTLGSNVENVQYLGGAAYTGTGNGLANTMDGGFNNDVLDGAGGADTIRGSAGNDTIRGGAGSDILTGGVGNDTFVFASGFGTDRITDFDANPTGGQDLIDVRSFGITATNFAQQVTIADVGADVLITIGGNSNQTIRLVGVADGTTVTVQDFFFG